MDGVEVSVMAWSSTTVNVNHMRPSLVCVRGSHVCASKHVCCCKVSKCVGVGQVLLHDVSVGVVVL